MNREINIYKVSGALDSKGFYHRITPITVEEKDKTYIGEGKRISKGKLMKIDTIFFENHKSIRYYTYCIGGQQQESLNLIKGHIIKKVNQYKEEIDILVSFI